MFPRYTPFLCSRPDHLWKLTGRYAVSFKREFMTVSRVLTSLGVVVHVSSPSTWEAQAGDQELKASLNLLPSQNSCCLTNKEEWRPSPAIPPHLYWHLPYWVLAARDPVSKSKTSPQTDGYSFFSVFWKWSFRLMERRGRAEFPCTTPPRFPVINILPYSGTRARNLWADTKDTRLAVPGLFTCL